MATTYGPTYVHTMKTKLDVAHTSVGLAYSRSVEFHLWFDFMRSTTNKVATNESIKPPFNITVWNNIDTLPAPTVI